jgi:hypothetical protein
VQTDFSHKKLSSGISEHEEEDEEGKQGIEQLSSVRTTIVG